MIAPSAGRRFMHMHGDRITPFLFLSRPGLRCLRSILIFGKLINTSSWLPNPDMGRGAVSSFITSQWVDLLLSGLMLPLGPSPGTPHAQPDPPCHQSRELDPPTPHRTPGQSRVILRESYGALDGVIESLDSICVSREFDWP